jgi:multiple antibiotic resistance protein
LDWVHVTNFFAALLAILNPFGNIAHFLNFTTGDTPGVRRAMAFLVAGVVFIILSVFFIFGNAILGFMGITLPAFQIGGGILLLISGLSMVRGEMKKPPEKILKGAGGDDYDKASSKLQQILVPLAIPLIVGPGTISTAILYAAGAREDGTFLALLGVILIVSLIVLACLLASQWILNVIGENGLQIMIRILGLMLVAVGVQFLLNGLAKATVGIINPDVAPPLKK